MNYDEIAKALEEEKRLNDELGKIIEEPSYYDPTHYEDEEGNICLLYTSDAADE